MPLCPRGLTLLARHVFVLAALLCLAPGLASAEEKPGPTQVASFDPLWIAYSTASLQYERLVAPAASLAIKARIGRSSVNPLEGEPYDRTVLGIGAGYHIYPQPGAPIGFYLAPGIDLLTRFKTTKSGSDSVVIAVPFFELGYSWKHQLGVYVGGSIGMQYVIGNVQDDIGGLDSLKGFVPRVSLRLGYAW